MNTSLLNGAMQLTCLIIVGSLFSSLLGCGSSDDDEVIIEPLVFNQKISNIIVNQSNIIFAVEVADQRFELFSYNIETNTRSGISDIFSANNGLNPVEICPGGNHIVYRADKDNDGFDELYSNSIDGSNEVQLTDNVATQSVINGETVTHSNWQWVNSSPLERIIFRSDPDNDDIYEIQSVNIDATDLLLLSGNLDTLCFSSECWKTTSSGEQITFLVETEDDESFTAQSIYSIAADGSGLVMLNQELSADSRIHDWQWAPNDSSIAYISQNIGSPNQLYIVTADASTRTLVNTTSVSVGVKQFSWSPNSLQIAFNNDNRQAGQLSLFNYLVTETEIVWLIDTFDVANPVIVNWQWSPDSSRIGYLADQSFSGITELFTVQADGLWHRKMSQSLTNQTNPVDPLIQTSWLWSPNSNYVSFMAESQQIKINDELYVSAADGSRFNLVNLALDPEASLIASNEQWLEDSSRIVYQVTADDSTIDSIYSVLPDGTNSKRLTPSLSPTETIINWFSISTDSSNLLFQVASTSENNVTLQRATVDALARNDISRVGIASQAQWFTATDGLRVIYVHKINNNSSESLYSVLPDGTDKQKIY
jgi:hypothetical protein